MQNIPTLGTLPLSSSPSINATLQKQIEKILLKEKQKGEEAYGPAHVVDLLIFDKPSDNTYAKFIVSEDGVKELFQFTKELYPTQLENASLNEYWTTWEIFRNSKELNDKEFAKYFKSLFLNKSFYKKDEAAFVNRAKCIEKIIEKIQVNLFRKDNNSATITLYITTDANNENTDFAPYIFVGATSIVVVLRRWIL
jgi:hypothetical protein